ncbi:MAG: 30S ribosomal protein S6 [bacterium]
MNNYEMTLIIDPNLSEKDEERLQEEIVNLLKNHGVNKFYELRSERRAFAFPIRKHREGTYFFFSFLGPTEVPEKIRRDLMHREEILRLAFFRLPHPPAGTESSNPETPSSSPKNPNPSEVTNV